MTDMVLEVTCLSKSYKKYSSSFRRFFSWFDKSQKPVNEFWALNDVNIQVKRGESVAIIGVNGAGKSTLLKLIVGTTNPTLGQVKITGTVSSILELGLGFNPEFSGRENVYLAGGLIGISREKISSLLGEIQEFSELEMFFDEPLRTYSSGMQARLAFSIATAIRPDLLIVDEVLSVGDGYFQHKSFARIKNFCKLGTSVLLVTHNLQDIKAICSRTILLERGSVIKEGVTELVVDFYKALILNKENSSLNIKQKALKQGFILTEIGTKEAVLEDLYLTDTSNGKVLSTVNVGQLVTLNFTIRTSSPLPRLVIGHMITDVRGHIIWGTNTWYTDQVIHNLPANQKIEVSLEFHAFFGPGSYAISLSLVSTENAIQDCYHKVTNAHYFEVMNINKKFFIGTSFIDSKLTYHS